MQRRGLSATERIELWRRWKAGQSLSDIGRALRKHAASVFYFVTANGGMAPSRRHRSARTLSLNEREEISRGLGAERSFRQIAASLKRPTSTISREVHRNGGRVRYRAALADAGAWTRARRPQRCKLAQHRRLRNIVASRLARDWSPQQIAGWLKATFPDAEDMNVSHETIYRTLFIQARGVLRRELLDHLRTRRRMRRGKHATTAGQQRSSIVDGISIRERPAEIEDRAVPGHWEGDLISGSRNSHIATLVERRSRFTLLVKVNGKDTESVVSALIKQVRKLPAELRRSLTWDRGAELAKHKAFSVATDAKVYFCDPRSPWQRGTNENTNRLLRQYFPKGTELTRYSQRELNKVARLLNQRPRKTLEFRTPAATLTDALR